MNWILFGIIAIAVIWVIGALRSPERAKAPNVLNNQGLPQGFTRADHRRNDEE